MLNRRGYMHELQRLYAGYSDNKANSAQFQLGLGLSLAICSNMSDWLACAVTELSVHY